MSCPVCGASTHEPHLTVNGHQIVRCPACAHQWVDPAPSPQALRELYAGSDYFRTPECGYDDYVGGEATHRRLGRRRLQRIERLIGVGSLLDLGCAAGFFVDEARRRGWTALGVEIAPEMRAEAARRGIGGVLADLDDAAGANPGFDAITMWEYIEHVPDPLAELRRARGLLRPGGLLAISTPNTAHRLATTAPREWPEYRPPAHLSFFRAATLGRLLDRAEFVVRQQRFTAPVRRFDGAILRLLRAVGGKLGTGATRKTPLWWLYSLSYRLAASPAALAGLVRPERVCAGLEIYAAPRRD